MRNSKLVKNIREKIRRNSKRIIRKLAPTSSVDDAEVLTSDLNLSLFEKSKAQLLSEAKTNLLRRAKFL